MCQFTSLLTEHFDFLRSHLSISVQLGQQHLSVTLSMIAQQQTAKFFRDIFHLWLGRGGFELMAGSALL